MTLPRLFNLRLKGPWIAVQRQENNSCQGHNVYPDGNPKAGFRIAQVIGSEARNNICMAAEAVAAAPEALELLEKIYREHELYGCLEPATLRSIDALLRRFDSHIAHMDRYL